MKASISAGVVVKRVLNENIAFGEVLFVHREDGTYSIPAGHSLDGETPRQCAVREFLEETGYEVTLDGLIKVVTLAATTEHPLSLGFIFRGKIGPSRQEGELELVWIGPQRFCELLGQGKILLPQFHIPAFWGSKEAVPVDVVFEEAL